jgi:hypothetical protein
MRRPAAVIAALCCIGLIGSNPATAGELEDCLAHATDADAAIECQRLYDTHGSGGSTDPGDPGDLATYEYIWLPACAHTDPDVPGSLAICPEMMDCVPETLWRLGLWVMQITDASGKPVDDDWNLVHVECRDPDDLGETRRTITWQDVLTEVRTIEIPAAAVKAPSYTLVNLDTTFYTEPDTIDRTLSILGYTVDITITPASFTWHWGRRHHHNDHRRQPLPLDRRHPHLQPSHPPRQHQEPVRRRHLRDHLPRRRRNLDHHPRHHHHRRTHHAPPHPPSQRRPRQPASAARLKTRRGQPTHLQPQQLQPVAAEDTPGTTHPPSATTASAGNG